MGRLTGGRIGAAGTKVIFTIVSLMTEVFLRRMKVGIVIGGNGLAGLRLTLRTVTGGG